MHHGFSLSYHISPHITMEAPLSIPARSRCACSWYRPACEFFLGTRPDRRVMQLIPRLLWKRAPSPHDRKALNPLGHYQKRELFQQSLWSKNNLDYTFNRSYNIFISGCRAHDRVHETRCSHCPARIKISQNCLILLIFPYCRTKLSKCVLFLLLQFCGGTEA